MSHSPPNAASRYSGGACSSYVSVTRTDIELLSAMRSHFGSHDAALRTTGIDPESVRKGRRRRGDEILATLRELARDGSPSLALAQVWKGQPRKSGNSPLRVRSRRRPSSRGNPIRRLARSSRLSREVLLMERDRRQRRPGERAATARTNGARPGRLHH
jgi:hypothetical protein